MRLPLHAAGRTDCLLASHRLATNVQDLTAWQSSLLNVRTKPPPAAVWQSLGPVLFRWGLGEGRRDFGEYVLVTCHWLSANGVRNQLVASEAESRVL